MTTLNIDGTHVTVDDSFLSLSPADQQSTVDHIAASLAPAAPDIGRGRESMVSALRGIPIAGAYADKGAAALNAAAQPFTETGLSNADNFSDRMAENEKTIGRSTDAFERANPIGTTVGKLALGTAATLPLASAAPAAMGVTGGFAARTAMGGLSNAALGGVDAGVRGNDIGTGAAVGGLIGAAAPVVGAVASPFMSGIMARLNPAGYAERQVARAVSESGRPIADITGDVTQAAREGQGQFTLADALGKPGQDMLSTVARAPGQGGTDVAEALNNRQAGQGRRISNALSEGFNAPETAAQTEARMTAARGAQADADYGAVRNGSNPVDLVGTLNHLDSNIGTQPGQVLAQPNDSVEAALQPFRERLARVNPDDFAAVQRIRGDMADSAQSAFQSGQGNKARLLRGALRELDSSLEVASPGFRQANANFAQSSRDIEAVGQGRDAFNRGRTEDTLPAFNSLRPEAQQAFRAGYADPAIAQTQGAAFGVNKARPLINDAFRDEANAIAPGNDLMQRRIGREQTMFSTRERALGGSKTADNLANHEALGINPSMVVHAVSGNWHGAIGSIIHAGSHLTGNTPAVRKAVADILLQHGANLNPAQLNAVVTRTISQIQTLQRLARSGVGAAAVTTNANQANRKPPIFAPRNQ